MSSRNTDVLIIGAGPVGLILAHQLGRRGVNCIQLEQAAALSDEPRAVGFDPESLRSLKSLDLLEQLRADILWDVGGEYLNATGERLFALESNFSGPLGYPNLCSFSQPAIVTTLAAELDRYDCVSLEFEQRLLDFKQGPDGVVARVENSFGETEEISAQYLVACDGGRSGVRTQLGIKMEGESNPLPWLVIDTREEEYDGERQFRFFCDPARPGMFLQTPHSTRRWEWMVMPGEDRNKFLEDETIHSLLEGYVDIDKIDIFRRRVYDFHALLADKFQDGRVFLAGDAAHMTPPFAGQGLNSGIRDVTNIGWKLAAVLNKGAPAALLDSYEPERRPHSKELIDVALMLGEQIQPTDPEAAALRDAAFADLNSQPAEVMDGFVGGIFKAMVERSFESGAAVAIGEDFLAGRMLTQPQILGPYNEESMLDDHLGEGFAIVGFQCDPRQEIDAGTLSEWEESGVCIVSIGQGTNSLGEHREVFEHLFAQGEANMVLVRPDRFCMTAFSASNAVEKLNAAAQLLRV
jgi:3-(3-hydroxy-phenyl)propionate hydroxylase